MYKYDLIEILVDLIEILVGNEALNIFVLQLWMM